MSSRVLALALAAAAVQCSSAIECSEGYTCFEDPDQDIVWVMKDDGNTNGPSCSSVCQNSLCGTAAFHNCKADHPAFKNMTSFATIASGLGFTCEAGGCWDSVAPGDGLVLVSKNTGTNANNETTKRCYFPDEDELSCNTDPGNGNCFGERYQSVCPCEPNTLEESCPWESPPNNQPLAKWPTSNGTSCVERINYWRKRACDEGWRECPPCGLPPMAECEFCHSCVNAQAKHNKANGAHSSFKRCGELVAGDGGGQTCADVIDAFISERNDVQYPNGDPKCEGHCGPIVKHGCQTFSWGMFEGFHVLNWRACNTDVCASYCADPSGEGCFLHAKSPTGAPLLVPSEEKSNAGAMAGGVIGGLLAVALIAGAAHYFLVVRKKQSEAKTNLDHTAAAVQT